MGRRAAGTGAGGTAGRRREPCRRALPPGWPDGGAAVADDLGHGAGVPRRSAPASRGAGAGTRRAQRADAGRGRGERPGHPPRAQPHAAADRRLHRTQPARPELSPGRIARAAGISRSHLYALFADDGETVSGFLRSRRLQAAYELLVSDSRGSLAISEVAYRTGFRSPAHFSRSFSRQFNATPRAIRATGAHQ